MARDKALLTRTSFQWLATSVIVGVLLALVATVTVVVRGQEGAGYSATPAAGITVSATDRSCSPNRLTAGTGPTTFTVDNASKWPTEIYLVKLPSGGSVARTIVLGPGTTVSLQAILGPGSYGFQCLQGGQLMYSSGPMAVTGPTPSNVTPAITQASVGELQQADGLYLKYAGAILKDLSSQTTDLRSALASGDLNRSRTVLLAAQENWERVGAAYDSFGDLGQAVEGQPDPGKNPATDPDFTGLLRIEYGLYHGEPPQHLVPVAGQMQSDLAKLIQQLPELFIAKGTLPLRAHEILEDALRDHLSGQDNQGSGMAFALTLADVDATRTAVSDLEPSLDSRKPGFVATINTQLNVLAAALAKMDPHGNWIRFQDSTLAQRQPINSAISAVLETLSQIPQLMILPQGIE